MKSLEADMTLSRVDSMQWNRSIQTEVLDDETDTQAQPVEIDPAVIENVRKQIQQSTATDA